jgi:predicted membrane protein
MKANFLVKLLIGGFFILLGLGFLFDQIFNVSIGNILGLFWPLAIMLIGLYILIRSNRHLVLGLIILFLGGALLLDQVIGLPFSIWELWPLILVFIGIKILFPSRNKKMESKTENYTEGDYFESNAVFWGESRKVRSDALKGGKITTVFGGSEIDLRECKIDKDGALIEIDAVFGGSEIKVSEDVLVKNNISGVLGGVEDKTSKPTNPDGIITISGNAVFGGIEIRN